MVAVNDGSGAVRRQEKLSCYGRAMPVLDAQALQKSLGSRTLLDQVTVTIALGERVGLVGDNGAGKSTLARILAGTAEADLGTIHRQKGATVQYLEQEPSFVPGQTALAATLARLDGWQEAQLCYERVCEQIASLSQNDARMPALLEEQSQASATIERTGGWNAASEATTLLAKLGLSRPDQSIETMSGGEQRRVALAAVLLNRPDLAILDEPTNHLDGDAIAWLEQYLLESFRGALLLITHDRFLLNRVVDRTWEVSGGRVFSYPGGWESYLAARADRLAQERRAEDNRRNFLRKELEWLRRQPKARTGKQKARVDRAEAALNNTPVANERELRLDLSESRLGNTVLDCRDLSVERGGRRLIEGLTLNLSRGDRVGIVGRSGAGKTSLLATLLGHEPPLAGSITRGKNTKIAYLDQQRGGLSDSDTVFDAITGGRPSVKVGESEYSSYSYLERFRFSGQAVRQTVGGLSGGERARVALARLLLEPANLLVLDEPTNDLDVMTLTALEDLILELKGAALLVSHDRYFLDRVATSVLALDGEGTAHHLQGGYSAYSEWRRSREAAAEGAAPRAEKKQPTLTKKKKLTWAEDKELRALVPELEQLDAAAKKIEAALADPALYEAGPQQAQGLNQELEALQNQLADKEQRWLELEEKKGG